ncbi:MAG: electron transfer flavoprotein subunit beta/FixA family protein [Nitrososphaerota archaeon]
MDIIVCVKYVPDVSSAELRVDSSGRDIDRRGLNYDINEWDDYALEVALMLREKHGGSVTAVSIGGEEAERVLRRCLAKGADKAVRIGDPRINLYDPFTVARVLSAAAKKMPFDLILTGVQANDDGYAITGPAIAQHLNLPHATLAKKIDITDGRAVVNRELEGGVEEVVELDLPAVVTVQTGIVELRYVSVLGIRMAMRREIRIMSLDDLGLSLEEVSEPWIRVEELYAPRVERRVEFVSGGPEEVASKIVEVLKGRGLL